MREEGELSFDLGRCVARGSRDAERHRETLGPIFAHDLTQACDKAVAGNLVEAGQLEDGLPDRVHGLAGQQLGLGEPADDRGVGDDPAAPHHMHPQRHYFGGDSVVQGACDAMPVLDYRRGDVHRHTSSPVAVRLDGKAMRRKVAARLRAVSAAEA